MAEEFVYRGADVGLQSSVQSSPNIFRHSAIFRTAIRAQTNGFGGHGLVGYVSTSDFIAHFGMFGGLQNGYNQRCLRRLPGIKWYQFAPNAEVH